SGSVLLNNALTFNNSTVTFAGSNPLLFAVGTPTLTAATNNFFNVTNTAAVNFDTAFANNAGILTKLGPGTLIISDASGAAQWTGGTYVNAGTLQAQASAALGTGTVYVNNNANVTILGTGLNLGNAFVLNGSGPAGKGAVENLPNGNQTNTISGGITLQSP